MRPYDWKDDVHTAVTFEFNKDLKVIKRKVYSAIDWLGDIGGLSGSLYGLLLTTVLIFQYQSDFGHLSSQTYTMREHEADGKRIDNDNQVLPQTDEPEKLVRIPRGFFGSIKLSLQRIFCLNFTCCHSKRDRLAHEADKSVKNELKVVRWINFMRTAEIAIRSLTSDKQYENFKQ